MGGPEPHGSVGICLLQLSAWSRIFRHQPPRLYGVGARHGQLYQLDLQFGLRRYQCWLSAPLCESVGRSSVVGGASNVGDHAQSLVSLTRKIQKQLEHVDKVQVEREGAQDRELLLGVDLEPLGVLFLD
jgi:hypothetical protein